MSSYLSCRTLHKSRRRYSRLLHKHSQLCTIIALCRQCCATPSTHHYTTVVIQMVSLDENVLPAFIVFSLFLGQGTMLTIIDSGIILLWSQPNVYFEERHSQPLLKPHPFCLNDGAMLKIFLIGGWQMIVPTCSDLLWASLGKSQEFWICVTDVYYS